MYNYYEIKQQNLQDAFSLLYLRLAESITEIFGRNDAERILREATRRAGKADGASLLEEHNRKGIPVNLRSLFCCGSCPGADPRRIGRTVADEEERRIWEVYVCPLAHFWNAQNGAEMGSFFCEEYERARVLAYTEGQGQLHLSSRLTSKSDYMCLFAAFFREANAGSEASFGNKNAEAAVLKISESDFSSADSREEFRNNVGKMMVSICTNLYEVSREMKAEDGVSAVRRGIEQYGREILETLENQAERTGKMPDTDFIGANFPLNVGMDYVRESFLKNFVSELMKQLVPGSIETESEE